MKTFEDKLKERLALPTQYTEQYKIRYKIPKEMLPMMVKLLKDMRRGLKI